jgi:surface antigen
VASPAPPPPRLGTVAPIRGDARTECREFQQTIMIGGQPQKAYGTACHQPDGTWKIVH